MDIMIRLGGGGSGTLSIGGLSREIRVSLLLFVFCLSFSVFFLVLPFSLLWIFRLPTLLLLD